MADAAVVETTEHPVSKSIIDTVDGPGASKRLAEQTEDTVAAEARQEAKRAKSPKGTEQKDKQQAADDLGATPKEEARVVPFAEAEKYFLDELSDKEIIDSSTPDTDVDEAGSDQTAEEDGTEEQNLSPRANKRIRSLVAQAKEARAIAEQASQKIAKYDEWAATAYNHNQKLQAEKNELLVRLASLEARLESGGQARQQDPAESHVSRFKQELAQELVDPQIKALRDEVASIKQERIAERERMRQIQTRQRYSQEADSAAREYLFKDYPQEIAEDIGPAFADLSLAWAYGRNISITQAAQELRPMFLKYGLGHLRARTNNPGAGKAVARSQSTTPPAPRAGVAAKQGIKLPTKAQAVQAGFKDPLEYMMAKHPGILGSSQ